ncbi:restriction endonuclease [Mycobacterium paragordonae]|uniref:restriction endonuclease n=1 Tax=Mycobacterium paragordonae TaxID=1389713 RepID=UPI00140ACFAA|nr:restriction endonuclease [Mycobacterium paragordonae]
MARVEWTRQSGEAVEAVVAMLLCSRHTNAVRVRPSQGDGGIDVFVPGLAGFGAERAVYQVKKYCANLTGKQKREIKRSYHRVIAASQEEGWRITEWHLVMPLDLTDKNLGWLDEVVKDAEFTCETNGLTFCDSLAAQYPKVIDYYLRDGKDRLQAEVNNLTAILSGRTKRQDNDALIAQDVLPDLVGIHKALNACDPFYRYDFAVSDTAPPTEPSPNDVGLVAACAFHQDSVWVNIKIFALSSAALEERPISLQFQLAVPKGDETLLKQVQKFIDYGAPLSMPPGTVSGSLDLPGGLGGPVAGCSLHVMAVADMICAERTELLLAMVPPDSDTPIASTVIRRTDYSVGQGGGFRSLWTDTAGLFTIEMLASGQDIQMGIDVKYELAERIPEEIIDTLNFLAAMHKPNRFAFGRTYGPPDFAISEAVPHKVDSDAKLWAVIAEALCRLQQHVVVRLRMPHEMTEKQAGDIIEAAKLMSGEALSGKLSGPFTVRHHAGELAPNVERKSGCKYEFVTIKPIEITLGSDVIPIGKEALFFVGQYLEVSDTASRVEPVTEGTSVRYSGTAEVNRVLARNLQGAFVTDTDVSPGSPSDETPDEKSPSK